MGLTRRARGSMSVDVVAVRWSCWACEATVITAPGLLPAEWFEWPPPPWRASHPPRHCCPDHAAYGRRLHRAQWARYESKTYVVAAVDYEVVKARAKQILHELELLKFSGQ